MVLAQSGYSNSSLSGTYGVSVSGADNSIFFSQGRDYSGVGTIQFDGDGKISGGTLTLITVLSSTTSTSCPFTLTGTYSIQSTGLGTATVNFSSTAFHCAPSPSIRLNLAAAQQGASLLFSSSDGPKLVVLSGTAIRQ
jgi:hypothetical protein